MDEPVVNLRAARVRHGALGVPSPCLSVCRMDRDRAFCEGCWRSIDEIAAWSRMADADKLVVWERIETRQREAASVLTPPEPLA
jgi:predicted Fe-S protein YdhL (DUF1289 family)